MYPIPSSHQGSLQPTHVPSFSNPHNVPQPSISLPELLTQAILILKDEDDRNIFAWLGLARSLLPPPLSHSGDALLTSNQLNAIAILGHHENDDIHAWLSQARTLCKSRNVASCRITNIFVDGFRAPAIFATSHIQSSATHSGHDTSSLSCDVGISSSFNRSLDPGLGQQASTQTFSTQHTPTATNMPSQTEPKYYCTTCPSIRTFNRKDRWIEHEKAHETNYCCAPCGPKETTPWGIQCAFCGILNPSDSHLEEHNVQASHFYWTATESEFLDHLSGIHRIHDRSRGRALAQRWEVAGLRRTWSCGFCGAIFTDLNDRLNHIASLHFYRRQDIFEWDVTKVIHGLLHQPDMVDAWKAKLASLGQERTPNLEWKFDTILDLQYNLEVGPTDYASAVSLADTAIALCHVTEGLPSQQGIVMTTSFPRNLHHAILISPAGQGSNQIRSSDPVNQVPLPLGYGSSSATTRNTIAAPFSFDPWQNQSIVTQQGNVSGRLGNFGHNENANAIWPGSFAGLGHDQTTSAFQGWNWSGSCNQMT